MYVGITKKLVEEVRNKIRGMRHREDSTLGHKQVTCSGNLSMFVDKAWGEHKHLMDVIPDDWKGTVERAMVQYTINVENKTLARRAQVNLSPPLRVPPEFANNLFIDVSNDDPLFKEFIEWDTRKKEVENRWSMVENQIIEFLEKCKSVNEALKLWPQIEMYIPSQTLEKVHKKVAYEKTESDAANAVKDLDTEALTSAAVIARMSEKQV